MWSSKKKLSKTSKILAEYQTCHVAYQLKISSLNLMLADQFKNKDLKFGFLIGRPASNLWMNFKADKSRDKLSTLQGPISLNNGILLPKLFWPTVRKKCSTDQEKLLKFEAEGREFAKFLRLLDQFIQIVKGQSNFW